MKEVAFIVNPDCEFYKRYFRAEEEKRKFHKKAMEFFRRYDVTHGVKYYQNKRLGLQLNSEDKNKFQGQFKKYDDANGISIFKKTSPMQKAWTKEVVINIDFTDIEFIRLWFWGYITQGSYSLWDYNGTIYGYLEETSSNSINLPEYMTEIKMSEYYTALEECEQSMSDTSEREIL